jgi:hypothetical protein
MQGPCCMQSSPGALRWPSLAWQDIWQKQQGEPGSSLAAPERGVVSRAGRWLALFLLGGLTSIELMAIAVGFMGTMGFLWITDAVPPERLVTDPWLRSAWIGVVLALARPVTWVPYLLPFLSLRWLGGSVMKRTSLAVRNGLANLGSIALLAGALGLVLATVGRAGTVILSGLAFATGSGRFADLGTFRGDWTAGRISLLVASVVFVRLVLPPLGADLDLSREPILGFVSGGRGRFDRYLLIAVTAGALLLVGLAAFLAMR